MVPITRQRAEALVRKFSGKRIVVLGDVMLDEFIWGRVRRISPEAPVPVVEVERHTTALGGAGNVVSNLVALGAHPVPLTTVGDDSEAERLRAAFRALGVGVDGLVVDGTRPTTLKTRIIAHNQQVVRADRESRVSITSEVEEQVVNAFRSQLEGADAVVVSDYGKGLLTSIVLQSVLKEAKQRGVVVCLDPKSRSFEHYQPVTVITPNHQEAAESAGINIVDEQSLVEAGRRILGSLECQAVLITRGEEGMTLFTDGGSIKHIPTVAREVYDVTGAGDTVIATLAVTLASGGDFAQAAVLANHAAGVVVGKVGTATVTREELLSTM